MQDSENGNPQVRHRTEMLPVHAMPFDGNGKKVAPNPQGRNN